MAKQLLRLVCALLALVMVTTACSKNITGPTPVVEDPSATVTYVIGTERVDRHPVTMSRTGGQFLNTNPNQPLTEGMIKVQGLSLTGDIDLYIYPITDRTIDGDGRIRRCLSGLQSTDCPKALAGPVRAVNGQAVELGYVRGLTPVGMSSFGIVFYIHGDVFVGGSIYTTITGPRP